MKKELKRFLNDFLKAEAQQKGFSLIEIMVAIILLGVVMGGVGMSVMSSMENAKINNTGNEIKAIAQALDLYRAEFKKYPAADDGLNALIKKKILDPENGLNDPWGNEYVYIYPGTNSKKGYDLYSFGPNGQEGGGDDITNWKSDQEEEE